MPTHPPTLIHFTNSMFLAGATGCGDTDGMVSATPGRVTCFACRKSEAFKQAQVKGELRLLRDVIEEDPALAALADKAAARAWLKAQRNDRGMFTIEEFIHHGDYRSTRRVEVYAINAVTVDAVIQSSAYCYGSWLNPENPDHKQVRNTKLHQLVEDLKAGRTNRDVGWSTFRLITEH